MTASFKPSLTAPTVEQHPTGFGVGVAAPRISWRFVLPDEDDADSSSSSINSSKQAWEQTRYEIAVARGRPGRPSEAEEELYQVEGSASVLVPWPSRPLQSREQTRVRVRVYGNQDDGEPTAWSPWTAVEAGLLQRQDWTARPITSVRPPVSDIEGPLRPIRFRKTFVAPSQTAIDARARLYITSLGVYRAFLNGQPIGDHVMAPGWTSYNHRLNYQVFDVAALLKPGEANVLSAEVAEGWYAGRLGFLGGRRYLYGKDMALLAQLEMGEMGEAGEAGETGAARTVRTDASWVCRPSAIVRSEIYDGELYDAREETPDWPGTPISDTGAAASWAPVRALDLPGAELVAPDAPPVRVIEEVQPVRILTTPTGKTIVDFGQNLVGRLRVRSLPRHHRPRGHKVVFAHAEVLEHGELGTRPLREAKNVDTVVLAGRDAAPLRNWSPQFTFHGFRYVQVDGWSSEDSADGDNADEGDRLQLSSLCAQVLHTDLVRTGHFACSHPMVNKLHQNALWSMRGNFLSVPTDCPQRDERLGWTGDIQVFTPSASFLYNTAGMLGDWLRDLAAEQLVPGCHGIPPFVVPNVIGEDLWPRLPQAVWDDAAVLVPWALYQAYGDVGLLRRQYPSMVAWLAEGVQRDGADGVVDHNNGARLWDDELWQLGDWLDPTAPPEEPGNARTSGTLVADAYLVHVTAVMADISRLVHGAASAEARRYAADAQSLRAAFQAKYVAASGLLVGDTQTALSLALVFGLHDRPAQAACAADRLARLVRRAQFRVSTGFAGTPLVTHALTQAGHHQHAYRMLLERARPSWMYPLTMGATTIWERWDSMLPDGSVNPGEMTSFNHYALGSVVQWLHASVAGLRPTAPGWKTVQVAPIPGGGLTWAEAVYDTAYGRLESRWAIRHGDAFELTVVVPPNTRAQVILPHERAAGHGPENTGPELGVWVGAGRHRFASRWDSTAQWPPQAQIPPMRKAGPDTIVQEDEPGGVVMVPGQI